MDSYIQNKIFDEIKIGDSATIQRVLTYKDIQLFAIMSGDVNPAHVDQQYAESDMFHRIIAHGMWTGSLISTILGTLLPGPGTIYLGQTFNFLRPVSIGDTITATVTVKSMDEKKKHVELFCICSNQKGNEVMNGLAQVIAPTEKVLRKKIQLPTIEFAKEKYVHLAKFIQLADQFEPIITAVVHPVDRLSLESAIEAAKSKIIIPLLVGPEDKIRKTAELEKIDISGLEIIPVPHSHAAAEKAVELGRLGKVEAILKGSLHTDELMHPVMNKESGLLTGRRISHVSVMDIPTFSRPLFITDAAVNISPTLLEKKDIVQNAIDLFQSIGLGIPRVAILSAVETVTEKIPSTLDATALSKMAERGQITGAIVDGPLAFDNAISEEAAQIKHISSQVAGRADILVVPDLESGNMLLKELTLLSDADMAGIVLGARIPIILTSRSSNLHARQTSCALALLYTRRARKKA